MEVLQAVVEIGAKPTIHAPTAPSIRQNGRDGDMAGAVASRRETVDTA